MVRRAFVVAAALLLGAASCVRPDPAQATGPQVTVDVGVFHEALAPHGQWVWVTSFGWAWAPHAMAVGWRPYTHGHWVWTDYGWTWRSDWEWGWACFHYGRWAFISAYGWLWVPGDVWGPAWVAWRHGGGYVGWAPLPPHVHYVPGAGLGAHAAVVDHHVDSGAWSFVPEKEVAAPRVHTKVAPPAVNDTYMAVTKNVTRYETVQGRPRNIGVPVSVVEQAAGRDVPRFKVTDAVSPAAARRPATRAHELSMYRPVVASEKAPPAVVREPDRRPGDVTGARPQRPPAGQEARQFEREAPQAPAVRPEARPKPEAPAVRPEARPTPRPAVRPMPRPAVRPEARPSERETPQQKRAPAVRPAPRPAVRPDARPSIQQAPAQPKPAVRPKVRPLPKRPAVKPRSG